MSQYSPSKDLQSKSKSIYSSACQNEAELNQIMNRRPRAKKRTNPRYINNNENNNNNSFVRFNSKDHIIEKNLGEFNQNLYNQAYFNNYEYRSFHEEKTEAVNNKNVNINNNVNSNGNGSNLDKNLNIDENMKQFEISSINSNSNKQNFMEENTDTELNKIFGIPNSDKDSQKARKSKDLKNYSIYNYLNDENSLHNFKTMNITADNKPNLENQKILNSLYNTNNNINQNNQNNFIKNNLTVLNPMKNKKKNSSHPPEKKENLEQIIDKINFEGFDKDELDKKYFDNKLQKITTKSKNISLEKNKNIKTLYELQNFEADDSSITALNINQNGNLLGVGFQTGKIKIYEIMNYLYQKYKLNYCIKNLHEYLNFINEIPYKTLSGHPNEILDLVWLQSNNNNIFMLSASLDLVILWNLSKASNYITRKYFHRQLISCLSVNQVRKNIFGTCCSDNIIRLWPISRTLLGLPRLEKDKGENKPRQFYVQEDITTFSFFPDGNKAAVGTRKGKIYVYTIFPKIKFEYKFDCKNTFGKPIININFYSNNLCAVSSLDSRIRFVNAQDGKIIQKYKGHKIEKNKIKVSVDTSNDIIITGDETGHCYLWNIYNKEDGEIKNYNFEYFKTGSSSDIINVTQIVTEKCYADYFKKILSITNQIMLESIIIIGTDKGVMKILLNIK